jgi:hypothetical protein
VHPGHSQPLNANVTEAAKFSAVLDYRSLLNTNFKYGDGKINLFQLAVDGFLAGYLDLATNKTISQLWTAVLASKPLRNTQNARITCFNACSAFNNAMDIALGFLLIQVKAILKVLSPHGLELVGLPFTHVAYNNAKAWADKNFVNQALGLEVSYNGKVLDRPQLYLNEARQSALGLALYLGARLACVPQTLTHLKLLVLDDVLIGLDQSNRIPMLDVLDNQFGDWQIVLLTHDRLWFETARARAGLSGGWRVLELFTNNEAETAYRPTVASRESDVVEDYLQRATVHLGNSDWRASAVYARSAFEMWLKIQCAAHSIPIQFNLEPRKIDANVYFTALQKWASNNQAKPAFAGVLNVLALYRDTVFNPGSHSYPTTMSGGELRAAIAAMRFVNEAAKHGATALQLAGYLIAKPGVLPVELALAAGFLRVAFLRRLRVLARQKNLALPFTMEPSEISPIDLWTAMCAKGWPTKRGLWVAGINANKGVLLDDWTWQSLLQLSGAELTSALQAVNKH